LDYLGSLGMLIGGLACAGLIVLYIARPVETDPRSEAGAGHSAQVEQEPTEGPQGVHDGGNRPKA
jgi:hypothetical protein